MLREKPIFLIPRGRTGGSLLATILGTHKDLSMGYEIYPDKLAFDALTDLTVTGAIEFLEQYRSENEQQWIAGMPRNFFRVFCARVRRCGITLDELIDVMQRITNKSMLLDTDDKRLDIIDEILRFQMHKFSKKRWGSKMYADPNLLHKRHPDAIFLMMLRDGRDVLDSRLNVGNFQTNAQTTAHDWVNSIEMFEGFIKQPGIKGMLIKYETLVMDPVNILNQVFTLCELDFYPSIVNYEKTDIHLLKAPHGHLSARQIADGLNSKSIGRYLNNLSAEDLSVFESIAGDTLRRFDYL